MYDEEANRRWNDHYRRGREEHDQERNWSATWKGMRDHYLSRLNKAVRLHEETNQVVPKGRNEELVIASVGVDVWEAICRGSGIDEASYDKLQHTFVIGDIKSEVEIRMVPALRGTDILTWYAKK